MEPNKEKNTESSLLPIKIFFIAFLILILNSAYLAAFADPTLFYMGNVLYHVALGVVFIIPFVIYGIRHLSSLPAGRSKIEHMVGWLGFCTMLTAMAAGLYLIVFGNLKPNRWILHLHIITSVAAIAIIIVYITIKVTDSQTDPNSGFKKIWQWTGVVSIAAVVFFLAAVAWQKNTHNAENVIDNPLMPPLSMNEEGMFGEDGPFFPSSAGTNTKGKIPSTFFMTSETCGEADCHPDIYKQWSSSAHHFSSFNNQWYRKSIEYMQDVIGTKPSKWCGGCHDHAVLFNGMMDTPVREIIDTPEAQAGLACTSCHSIVHVKDTMGNGGYEIEYPPLHDLATSDNFILKSVHDFLLRVDPEPHRNTFLKPFHKGSAEFCSACHKVHLDQPVNHYRWIRGFNEYDNWQASGVSGQGARSFYYPNNPMKCADCHMPLLPSEDAGNVDGFVHSHRFPAANTAMPIANKDSVQLQTVIDFMQNRQVTIDIFAMSEPATAMEVTQLAEGGKRREEGFQMSSTFAVGEEQAMAVGRGGVTKKATKVTAPINQSNATVKRGDSVRIDVVVRTRGVGHFFPGGTVDAFDVWLELKAVDENGKTIFWSGAVEDGGKGPVEEGAHFYKAFILDGNGNPINKRNAWAARSVMYVNLIPPGAADVGHFRLHVPEDSGKQIHLTANLNYRKFMWWNTQWAFAGIRDPLDKNFKLTANYDNGNWIFKGDTSNVSGKIKSIPDLPIVVMATDEAVIKVLDKDALLPEITINPGRDDRERWNDYGIGLLLEGDLKGAQQAFLKVTEIEPDYADGWVNGARARLREGDIAGAQTVLTEALKLDPDLAKANYFYGLVLKRQGNYDDALNHLKKAASFYPSDRVVRNEIGRILFLKRQYAEATEELKKVLKIDPEDLQAHYNLMLSYRGLGDLENAKREQSLYLRFKADESAQTITGEVRRRNPEANNERQSIHEHVSVQLPFESEKTSYERE